MKYSKEEKMKYVRLHLDDHVPIRQIEREYGIGNALVSSWVKRYLQDGEDALEAHNSNPYEHFIAENPCLMWNVCGFWRQSRKWK